MFGTFEVVVIELCSLPLCFSTNKEVFINTGNLSAIKESIKLEKELLFCQINKHACVFSW